MKFHISQACEILIRGWLTLLFLTSHFRSDIVFTIEAYDQDGRWVIVHAVNLGLWIMIVMMVLQKLDYLKNIFFWWSYYGNFFVKVDSFYHVFLFFHYWNFGLIGAHYKLIVYCINLFSIYTFSTYYL